MREKSQNINLWQFEEVFAAIVFIFAVMLIYLGIAKFSNFDTIGLYYLITSQIVFYITIMSAVFYEAILKNHNTLRQFFGVENLSRSILFGVLGFVLLVSFATLIDLTTEKFLGVKSSDVYSGINRDVLLAISSVGVFAAPFAEEIFFRGFLQPVFVNKFGKM